MPVGSVAPVPRRFEPQQALGRAVRERREALALRQADVAERADIAEMHLSKIENGSGNPSLGTIWRLAAALELPASELIARVEAIDADQHRPGSSAS